MSTESTENANQTAGDLLRQTRIDLGLDLEQVSAETKIAAKSLRAMEEDDLPSLPAEAFTRGFYVLYANLLELNPDEILRLYGKQRESYPGSNRQPPPPPNKLAQQVGNMAERPTILPFSFIGAPLLLLLLLGFFLCWYFSWNPATYLSEKLRSFQSTTPEQQQVSTDTQPDTGEFSYKIVSEEQPMESISSQQQPVQESLALQATQPQENATVSAPEADVYKYTVSATFKKSTKTTITIDDNKTKTASYSENEKVKWQATEKMVIVLPATSDAELVLNGIPINLPKTDQDQITLQIPEYLLDQQ